MVAIRQKTWDSLSPDVQAAMTKAAAETQQYICNWIAAEDVRETDVMVKEQNLVVTRLSKEEVVRWEERLRSVPAEWAKETDAAGKPGTALLKAFREAPAN
jgi:TRAP-type C4-dicarboxylate transport system substrate-binding protein